MDDSSKTTDHDFNNSKKQRNDSASSDEISKSGPIWFNDEADGDTAHSERERKHLLQKIAKMIKSAGKYNFKETPYLFSFICNSCLVFIDA